MTAGQASDYLGAKALLGSSSAPEWLITDRGDDADCFRDALKDKGTPTFGPTSQCPMLPYGLSSQPLPT